MNWPVEPLATNKFGAWLRQFFRACRQSEIISGNGYRVKRGANGSQLEFFGGGGSSRPLLLTLRTVGDDWILCHTCDSITWNGTGYDVENEGDLDIYVAKPHKWRTSATSYEVKNGVVHRYQFASGPDTHNKLRTDGWGASYATTETQEMTPPWTLNEEIHAIPGKTSAEDPGGNSITWVYLSPDRQWGKYTA